MQDGQFHIDQEDPKKPPLPGLTANGKPPLPGIGNSVKKKDTALETLLKVGQDVSKAASSGLPKPSEVSVEEKVTPTSIDIGAQFHTPQPEKLKSVMSGILSSVNDDIVKGSSLEARISKPLSKIESGEAEMKDFLDIYEKSPKQFEALKTVLNIPISKEEVPGDKFRDDNYVFRVFSDYKDKVTEGQLEMGRRRREAVGAEMTLALPKASEYTGKEYAMPKSSEEVKSIITDIQGKNALERLKFDEQTGTLPEKMRSAVELSKAMKEGSAALPGLTQMASGFAFDEITKSKPNATPFEVGLRIFEITDPQGYALYKAAGGDQLYKAGFGRTVSDTPKKADQMNRMITELGIDAFQTFGNKASVEAANAERTSLGSRFTGPVEEETKHMIAARLLESGIKPHKATDEEKDAVAETLPDLNRDIWFSQNREHNNVSLPSTGLGYSTKGAYRHTIEDATKSLLGWMMPGRKRERALDVLEQQGTSDVVGENPLSKARLNALEEKEKDGKLTPEEKKEKEELEQYTDVRTGWQKFKDLSGSGVGQFAGFGTISAFTGGLGAARNIPTAIKALISPAAGKNGMLTAGYLMSRESNAREAAQMFPDEKDGFKRFAYGEVASGIDTFVERLFPEEKFLSGILKKEAADLIPKLTAQNLRKELNAGLAEKLAKNFVKKIGEQQKTPVQEGLEEMVAAWFKDIFAGILDPSQEAQTLEDLIEVGTQAYLSSQLLGVPKGIMAQRNKHVPLNAIWDAASDKQDYFAVKMKILEMQANNDLTQEEANDRIKMLNTSQKLYEDSPVLSGNMGNLSLPKRQNYLGRMLHESVLQEKVKQEEAKPVPDKNVVADYKNQIADSEKARKEIYDGGVNVTERNEEVLVDPAVKKATDQWKENIVAIEDRTDIDDVEKERLKDEEDTRHAQEISALQKDANLLNKVKSSPNVDETEKKEGLQYFIDKAGEAPIAAAERFGEDVAKDLLQRVSTKKLAENFKFMEQKFPGSKEAVAIEKELGRREEKQSEVNSFVLEAEDIGEEMYPILQRVNDADYINEKELDESADKLYDLMGRVEKSGMTDEQKQSSINLIEPLIQKLEGYEFRTKTETGTVTETKATIVPRKVVERKKDPALKQSEGSAVTVTKPNGTQVSGILRNEDGKYYVINEEGNKEAVFGEVAINDRDLSLPSEEEAENPIELDEDGNVSSITFKTKDGSLVKVTTPDKALDLAIQLRAEMVGEVPQQQFDLIFQEIQKEVQKEVLVSEQKETSKPQSKKEEAKPAEQKAAQPPAAERQKSEPVSSGVEAKPQPVSTEQAAQDFSKMSEDDLISRLSQLKKMLDDSREDVGSERGGKIIKAKEASRVIKYLSKKYGIESALIDMGMFDSYGVFDRDNVEIKINKSTTLDDKGRLSAALEPTGNISRRTIFHEYLHPFVEILSKHNKVLYDEIYQKALEENKRNQFADIEHYDKSLQQEELVTRYLDRLSDSDTPPTLLKRFMEWISKLFYSKRKNNSATLKSLSKDTTVEELYDVFNNYGNMKNEIVDVINEQSVKREINKLKRISEVEEIDPSYRSKLLDSIKELEEELKKYDLSPLQRIEIIKEIELIEKELSNRKSKRNTEQSSLKEKAEPAQDEGKPPTPPKSEPAGVTEEGDGVGITHAQTEETRQQYGLGEYEKGEEESFEEWDKEAQERLKKEGIEPLIKKLRRRIAPDKIEQRMMLQYVAYLDSVSSKNPTNENLLKLKEAVELSDSIGGSEVGRSLVARKGRKTGDESLASWFIREMEEEAVDELTVGQKLTVQKEWEEINKAKKEFEEYQSKREEEFNKRDAALVIEEMKKNRGKKTQDLAVKRKAIVEDIIAKFNEAGNKPSFLGAAQYAAIAPDVIKLGRNLVESGVAKLEEVVSKIKDALSPSIPSIEDKDIISILAGKHTTKKPTKNELTATWNDLREEAKLIDKLDTLERGEVPKTEKAKIERNRKITELRKQIKEHPTTELSQAKTRIKAQIEKIEKQLNTGDFAAPEKKNIALDEEGKTLRRKLIQLQKQREIRIEKNKYERRTKSQKALDRLQEAMNLPRSLMASMDFSAPLNQAAIATTAYPKMAAQAAAQMFRAAKDPKAFDDWFHELKESPRYEMMQEVGLKISDPHSPFLAAREEAFLSGYAEQASKFFGKRIGIDPIGGSNRAYVQYLNKMRVDLFNKFINKFEKDGKSYEKNKELYEKTARYVNNITGAGRLGLLEEHAGFFNALFFSPRLIASRLTLLNPAYFISLPKSLKIQLMRDVGYYLGIRAAVIGSLVAYSRLQGDDDDDKIRVETDMRSSDFGKVRQGKTRWDMWGGFQPYLRMAGQMISGQRKTLEMGADQDINRWDEFVRFMRGKLSPIPALAWNIGEGENVIGEKTTFKNVMRGFLPLSIQAAIEGWPEHGAATPLKVFGLSALGIGVGTFEPREREVKNEITISKREDGKSVQYKATLNDKQFSEYDSLAKKYMKEYVDKLQELPEYKEMTNTEKSAAKKSVQNAAILKAENEIEKKYKGEFEVKEKEKKKTEGREQIKKIKEKIK